jgi:ribosomal protein S27E
MSKVRCPHCQKQTVGVNEIGRPFPKTLREVQTRIRCIYCGWILSKEGGGWTPLGQVIPLVMLALILVAAIDYWPQNLPLHLLSPVVQALLIYRIYVILHKRSSE